MHSSWELNLGMFVVKIYTFKFKTRNKMLALTFELPGMGMIGFLDGLWVCVHFCERK